MESPLKIYGGKHYMLKHLLPLIPPHKLYVEPFGGTAKLLFAKPISPIEVYNDIDSNLVNFFKVLASDSQFDEFYKLCVCTPYSREIFYECRKEMYLEADPVKRAWKFFVSARMAFSGRHKSPSWARCITLSRRNMAMHCSSWISTIEGLPDIHARLMSVLIENRDYKKLIIEADKEDTFYYLDPPYVQSSRKGQDRYLYELSDENHKELIDIVLGLKGKVLLSGYENGIYKKLEDSGWERMDFKVMASAAARTDETGLNGEGKAKDQTRVESVWISPSCYKSKSIFG